MTTGFFFVAMVGVLSAAVAALQSDFGHVASSTVGTSSTAAASSPAAGSARPLA
jgi:hypothetical protein